MRRAPRALVAAFLLLALACPAASAAPPIEALSMAWDDCPISPGSAINRPFTCDSNLGSSSLYCAFSVAQPIEQIVGLELVVDVQHSLGALPDYWRLGPTPDCRHDMLSASVNFSEVNACVDPGFTGAALQDYVISEPGGFASQARIKAVAFVPSPQTRSVSNDTTYLAMRLVFSHDRTVNVSGCTGCQAAACLVFNSVIVRRVKGAFGGDITLKLPGQGGANWAYWRSTMGADCSMVPVRVVTWGSVKGMYR